MAVTTVGVTAAGSNGGANSSGVPITVSKPAGSTSGDWHFFIAGFNGPWPTWTVPIGWTNYHQSPNTGNEPLFIAYGPDNVASAYSFTPTASGTIDGGWAILTVRGLDATTPVLGISADGADGGNATTHSVGGVSWTGAADAVSLLAFTWQAGDTTVTWPSGWTQEWHFGDGTGTNGLTGSFEVAAVARNWTIHSSVTSLASTTITNAPGIFGQWFQVALKAGASAAPSAGPVTYAYSSN